MITLQFLPSNCQMSSADSIFSSPFSLPSQEINQRIKRRIWGSPRFQTILPLSNASHCKLEFGRHAQTHEEHGNSMADLLDKLSHVLRKSKLEKVSRDASLHPFHEMKPKKKKGGSQRGGQHDLETKSQIVQSVKLQKTESHPVQTA